MCRSILTNQFVSLFSLSRFKTSFHLGGESAKGKETVRAIDLGLPGLIDKCPPVFPSLVEPISGWSGWHNGKHPLSSQEKRTKLGDACRACRKKLTVPRMNIAPKSAFLVTHTRE